MKHKVGYICNMSIKAMIFAYHNTGLSNNHTYIRSLLSNFILNRHFFPAVVCKTCFLLLYFSTKLFKIWDGPYQDWRRKCSCIPTSWTATRGPSYRRRRRPASPPCTWAPRSLRGILAGSSRRCDSQNRSTNPRKGIARRRRCSPWKQNCVQRGLQEIPGDWGEIDKSYNIGVPFI